MSPLLFVIVMEALSCMMDHAVKGGGGGGVFVLLFGFSVGMSTINLLMVSHLLFVDNT